VNGFLFREGTKARISSLHFPQNWVIKPAEVVVLFQNAFEIVLHRQNYILLNFKSAWKKKYFQKTLVVLSITLFPAQVIL
jgi:hypothetical protein